MSDGNQVRTPAPPQGPGANGPANGHPAGAAGYANGAAASGAPATPAATPAGGATTPSGAPIGAPPGAAPQAGPATAPLAAPPAPKWGIGRRLILLAVLLVVLGAGGTVGYRYYYDSTRFVSTDNAQLAGRLMQVGPLVAGRVTEVRYDIGQRVARDTVVARVAVPIPVGTTGNGQPRLEFRQTEDAMVDVAAPADGVVIARSANAGDTVPAGQPLLTLVDPRRLWINANVEETQIKKLAIGQAVDVHVDALNVDLPGRVAAITPASAGTFSLIPSQNVSGNFTKVTQLIPVKIELDQPDPRLSIGTSVEVKIRIAD